jgi:CheY-like chemotaxis protein
MKRVLSIGNCGYDNGSLRALVGSFGAELAAAEDWSDAEALLCSGTFALVLVNRKLDADGSDGMEIIREIKQSQEFGSTPVMLLSNYPEYQAKAVADGAAPGFGKTQLQSRETVEKLATWLTAGAALGE